MLSFRGSDKTMALFGIEPNGNVTWILPDYAALDELKQEDVGLVHDDPKRYVATMSKAKRAGRIFVDYLRNDMTATAVSAFSVRARPGATVSTPVLWSELRPSLKPAEFNIHTVPERLAKQRINPWADYFKVKQGINPNFLKALKIDAK